MKDELFDIELSCAFTGHRQIDSFFDTQLLIEQIKNLLNKGVNTFYVGMAIGFDILAFECLLKLKKEYPAIKVIATIPCPNQSQKFNFTQKRLYSTLLSLSDKQVLISPSYTAYCMHARNRYMVDHSKYLICYLRKNSGGTFYTYNYALENDRKIIKV